jgi:hypothetical protein
MINTVINLLAVSVMIYFAVIKGVDRTIIRTGLSAILFWMALTILTLYGAFFLAFGIGEVMGGDISGLIHLAPAVLIYALVYLCWRRPFEGGITLMVVAIISGISVIPAYFANSGVNSFSGLIGVLPSFVAGLLLLIAWLIARRSDGSQVDIMPPN